MIAAEDITPDNSTGPGYQPYQPAFLALGFGLAVIIVVVLVIVVALHNRPASVGRASSQPASAALLVTPLSGSGQTAGATANPVTGTTAGLSSAASSGPSVADQQLQSASGSQNQPVPSYAQGGQNVLSSLTDGSLKGL